MAVLTENSVYGVIRASRPTFRNPNDKIAFAVHACFMAAGFNLHATGSLDFVKDVFDSTFTEEVSIDGWNEDSSYYGFVYSDPESAKRILLTMIVAGGELLVAVRREGGSGPTGFDIMVGDYVLDGDENSLYKNFGKLVSDIEKELVNKIRLCPYPNSGIAMAVLTENSVYGVIRASRPTFRNPNDKIAFAVHACFMAAGFHLHATGRLDFVNNVYDSSFTEEGSIDGWNQNKSYYGFVYSNPESTKRIKVTMTVAGGELRVSVRERGSGPTDFHIIVSDYVFDGDENSLNYRNFGKLVSDVEKDLLNKYEGQRDMLNNQTLNSEGIKDTEQTVNKLAMGVLTENSVYGSFATTSGKKNHSRYESQRDSLNNQTRNSEGTTDVDHTINRRETPEEINERGCPGPGPDPPDLDLDLDLNPDLEHEAEPDFQVGERVLVYYHQILYWAKILHVSIYTDSPEHVLWRYYISYNNCKEEWEEWASPMRILKSNIRIMREQKAALSNLPADSKLKIRRPREDTLDKKNKVNGRWRDDIYQEKDTIDEKLGTPLPILLFVRFVEDRELCVHAGLVVELPHPYPIERIVERFIAHNRELQKPSIRETILKKWITAFNEKASDFLYEPEREASVSSRHLPHLADRLPSELYGVEHFIRLLVKLPRSLLRYRGSSKDDMTELLADILSFIEANQNTFYHVRA